MEFEIKSLDDVQKAFAAIKTDLEAKGAENTKNFEEKMSAIELAIKGLTDVKPEVTADELKAIKTDLDITIKAFDQLQSRVKATPLQNETKGKTFNDTLAETIEANIASIQGFKPKSEAKHFEMKAVGDMSVAANFTGSTQMYQDVRPLVWKPYERLWLGDILPSGTSTGTQLIYPKENGGEGGVAEWAETSGTDKPEIDYDLTTVTNPFVWLAGHVIVDRSMLDDIPWLISYLQSKMLISLKTAENAFIMNRATTGLLAQATAYNGTYTAPVDRIVDAAWGQIVEQTFENYAPTHVVMGPREAVKIGLNKATGSGEYDLPEGSVVFNNGKLTVGGLDVVPTSTIAANNFLALDARATQFVKRLQPELRMFEDAALAKRNKIMFRIEERAALAVYNNSALVKGLLIPA